MPKRIPFSHIRAVFFDADDTLFELNGTLGEIYARICNANDFEVSATDLDANALKIWKQFRPEYRNEENGFTTSPEREKNAWYKFITLLLEDVTSKTPPRDLIDNIYDEFSFPRSRKLRPGILELVEKLNSLGLMVGVLSNNDARIVRLLERWELSSRFSHILPTADLGFKKPSVECFKIVANMVNLSPEAMLYIGDNLELDYLAAREAGWHSIWYNLRMAEGFDDIVQMNCHSQLNELL